LRKKTFCAGQLSDMGCIYHLGIDSGTLIEGNVCTNTSAYYYGGWGYYLASKNAIFLSHLHIKNEHFTKTGSGQT